MGSGFLCSMLCYIRGCSLSLGNFVLVSRQLEKQKPIIPDLLVYKLMAYSLNHLGIGIFPLFVRHMNTRISEILIASPRSEQRITIHSKTSKILRFSRPDYWIQSDHNAQHSLLDEFFELLGSCHTESYHLLCVDSLPH